METLLYTFAPALLAACGRASGLYRSRAVDALERLRLARLSAAMLGSAGIIWIVYLLQALQLLQLLVILTGVGVLLKYVYFGFQPTSLVLWQLFLRRWN
ncbi:MAG: hypothetical protein ACRDD1_16970 [Planctomycetia bacterium]